MLELEEITLDKKERYEHFFFSDGYGSADYCFGNAYIWNDRFCQSYAVVGDRLVTLLMRDNEPWFSFPVGSGDIAPAFRAMEDYCSEQGIPLKLCGITENHLELMPAGYLLTEDRDFSDYFYDIDSLCTYAGRHLHAKRNFCNRFEAENEWSFEPLTRALIPDCIGMLDEWVSGHEDKSLYYERLAILRGFEAYEELGFTGGVLFANGSLAGFSVGEKVSDDIFCTHFEKAFPDISGAYPMVCREMARMAKKVYPELRYVNREDDMGLPHLRESKLSYRPRKILMKYTAVKNEL